MKDPLWPITLTRTISDIHSGGFSAEEEKSLGFKEGELFETPGALHELITFHKKNFGRNLNIYKEKILVHDSNYKEVESGVFVHNSARIDQQIVFNTEQGIIVIEKDVLIKPFSYLVGPLRIDAGAKVNAHSHISGSYIGKVSNVGGELINSVMESYSNKAHYGCVGDSYVGSWVNIGGGSSVSNLKNTYGLITMNEVKTSEQFLGAVIADHVKIAVNTSIYTGKVIGVGAHIYGTVTSDVPAFANYISKDNLMLIPLEIALTITERMKLRRNMHSTAEDKAMLSYAYTATEDERRENAVKEGKLSF